MPRFALKALLTALALGRAKRGRTDWDRRILIISTLVTVTLAALYLIGKATDRW